MPQSSPWSYKPWWCQPWSILLTGTTIIGGTWIVTQTLWATILVAFPVLAWWSYFLILWPRQFKALSPFPEPSSSDS
ncbi:MAG: DUF6737 family protein [Cyanophyceae cyanobacterium]